MEGDELPESWVFSQDDGRRAIILWTIPVGGFLSVLARCAVWNRSAHSAVRLD
jgi:hypothetical protein